MSPGPEENIGISEIFVGRQREMTLINAAIDELASKRGQIVMLTGEPGIGKTTLAERTVEEAIARAHTTLHGACFDGEYSPPFWLWTQVIRSALESTSGAEAFKQLTAHQQNVLARIVPELETSDPASSLTDSSSPPNPRDDQGRFELHDAIVRYLTHLSRPAPALIWLDDLHWADSSDLVFLEFAAQQLTGAAVMILGTYRDTDVTRTVPLARLLGLVTPMKGFRRIQLSGLTEQEMEQLILGSSPVRLTAQASSRLIERAAGNPLFGREMARGMSGSGGSGDIDTRLPEGIAEAIGRRMNGIDLQQIAVLQTAAVLGTEFSLSELDASSEQDSATVNSSIEAARERRLIEELARSPGNFRFTHALIQETLLDELTPTKLVQTHARIATALVGQPETLTRNNLSSIARHYREGVLLLDLNEAISHALRAGDHALANYSFAEAADHFGWAAHSAEDKSDSPERAFLIERVAVSSLQAIPVDPQPGWDTLCEAVRMYIRLGMNDEAVKLASFPAVIGGMTGVVPLIEDALKVATPGTVDRGWLLARYIVSLADSARPEDAEMAFAETIEIAEELNDRSLKARALVHGAQARYRANDPEMCVSRGLPAIDLAFEVGDQLSVLRVLDFCVESLCGIGRIGDATALLERCKQLGVIRTRTLDTFNRAIYAHMMYQGQWDRLYSLNSELPADPRTTDLKNWHAVLKSLRLGRYDPDDHQVLDATVSKWTVDSYHISFSILATWLQVRVEPELLRVCEALRYDDPVMTFEGEVRIRALAVLLALQHGESPAMDNLDVLRNSLSPIIPRTDVPIDRILGAVSVAAGDYESASEHFEASTDFCRRARFKPSLAWSLFDLIRLAEKGPATVTIDRVRAATEEALKVCTQIEMPALAVLVQESLARLAEQRGDSVLTRPDGLSEREVEVLKLVAAGHSNQEIADELFISRHTVVRHVSNIFQKSGASNRTEAATYAHQHEILRDDPSQ